MDLQSTIALVTGANGDLGQWYIEALLRQGASRIYACDGELGALNQIIAKAPQKIVPIVLDVTNPDSIKASTQHCQGVRLLINNAGAQLCRGIMSTPAMGTATANKDASFLGEISMCRAFAPMLKNNGGGAIINMLSLRGLCNQPVNSPTGHGMTNIPTTTSTTGPLKTSPLKNSPLKNSPSTASDVKRNPSPANLSLMAQSLRNALEKQKTLVVDVCLGTIETKDVPPPALSPAGIVQAALQGVINETPQIYPG